jgi:hypothetical protein
MVKTNKNFKGLDYYKLQQDDEGNIKLNNYNDVFNARRARVDILLDNTPLDNDADFSKLNKALGEKLENNHELSLKEDEEIAQEELKLFSVLDNLDDLSNIESECLFEVSLLLSDLSFIERNIVLNDDKNSDLAAFKSLFIEKKTSGEEYSNEECRGFLDDVDEINSMVKLELESRIQDLNYDEHDDLQDEIGKAMNSVDKSQSD